MNGPLTPQKLCPSCGASVAAEANICSQCGYNFNTGPYAQPPTGQPPQGGPNPNWQANYPRAGYEPYTAADGLGIAALIIGILSFPLTCACYMSIPSGILALILGGFGLGGKNRHLAIAGMICGGIALAISAILVIVTVTAFGSGSSRYP
jgi:hypothetical protein